MLFYTTLLVTLAAASASASGTSASVYSNFESQFLSETNSLGVVTGQPTKVTTQPLPVTTQAAAASLTGGGGVYTYTSLGMSSDSPTVEPLQTPTVTLLSGSVTVPTTLSTSIGVSVAPPPPDLTTSYMPSVGPVPTMHNSSVIMTRPTGLSTMSPMGPRPTTTGSGGTTPFQGAAGQLQVAGASFLGVGALALLLL